MEEIKLDNQNVNLNETFPEIGKPRVIKYIVLWLILVGFMLIQAFSSNCLKDTHCGINFIIPWFMFLLSSISPIVFLIYLMHRYLYQKEEWWLFLKIPATMFFVLIIIAVPMLDYRVTSVGMALPAYVGDIILWVVASTILSWFLIFINNRLLLREKILLLIERFQNIVLWGLFAILLIYFVSCFVTFNQIRLISLTT